MTGITKVDLHFILELAACSLVPNAPASVVVAKFLAAHKDSLHFPKINACRLSKDEKVRLLKTLGTLPQRHFQHTAKVEKVEFKESKSKTPIYEYASGLIKLYSDLKNAYELQEKKRAVNLIVGFIKKLGSLPTTWGIWYAFPTEISIPQGALEVYEGLTDIRLAIEKNESACRKHLTTLQMKEVLEFFFVLTTGVIRAKTCPLTSEERSLLESELKKLASQESKTESKR